jgi:hypothetical protein
MTRRARCGWLVTAIVGVTLGGELKGVDAADANKACGLLTPSELEGILGSNVTLNGGLPMPGGKTDICTGQAPTTSVMLRLVTGLDPGRDRSGSKEKAGIELFKKMGATVDVKTFGPITCSTIEPPADQMQKGINTTCTVTKDTAVAGIELTAKSRNDMVSIERLRPLAEKMASRF